MNAKLFARCVLGLAGLGWAAAASAQFGIGTGFTFQGELRESGSPANGSYDFRARLVAPGSSAPVAESVFDDVAVTEGRFMLPLDFTDVPFREFGDLLGVELAARAGASIDGFLVISPFIRLEPAPYALAARTVMPGAVGSSEINPQQVQRRVTGTCTGNAAISAIAADGTVTCDADDAGVTIDAAFGLIGGGSDGVVPLAIDPVEVQRRVNGTCAAGSSIRTINEDGTVECEVDDGVGSIVTVTGERNFGGTEGNTTYGAVFANCPEGTSAISGGYTSNCPGVRFFGNSPDTAGRFWAVGMLKDARTACPGGVVHVTAFAVCLPL